MLEFSPLSFISGPWAIILAAGKGSRLAEAAGMPKQFLEYKGRPLFWQSALTLRKIPGLRGIYFVFPPDDLARCRELVAGLDRQEPLRVTWRCIGGGPRRQDSVRNALVEVPFIAEKVLIHDAARPFFSMELVTRIMEKLNEGAEAVIPGIPVTDTIKRLDENGCVAETLPRASLAAVQTPQGFDRAALVRAHRDWLRSPNTEVTDDAALIEAVGGSVVVVPGEAGNKKITNPEDLAMLESAAESLPCTGFGYDVHRYGGTRPLRLGGVAIDTDMTVEAHSDGDVLLHAVMDALLGMCGRGDIGDLFPDTDPAYDNASSALLLERVLDLCAECGVRITHIDCTVVAQKPKLARQKDSIRSSLCRLLHLTPEQVGIKATTEEKLGFTGAVEGLKAYAVAAGLRTVKK